MRSVSVLRDFIAKICHAIQLNFPTILETNKFPTVRSKQYWQRYIYILQTIIFNNYEINENDAK